MLTQVLNYSFHADAGLAFSLFVNFGQKWALYSYKIFGTECRAVSFNLVKNSKTLFEIVKFLHVVASIVKNIQCIE